MTGGRLYTPEEDALLKELVLKGWASSMIAKRMDRSANSIISRTHIIGITILGNRRDKRWIRKYG